MFRKISFSHLTLCFICLLAAVGSGSAQETAASQSPAVTAATTAERVRFTAPSTVQQIRLEVYNAVGVKLFDNEVRGGNVLDWRLQDGQAEPLADGAYLCLVTVKYLSGRLSQKLGALRIEQGQATLQPAEASQMSAQQAQAIGPVEAQASLTVLGEAEWPTATVIAHTGSEGQLIRGSGALSFRLGDFYRGQDQEQMRLTAEGKLGLGVSDPQAKLDVAGLIRTSEGIVFPDGTVQTTAYVASGRTLSERAYMQRDAAGRTIAGLDEKAKIAQPLTPDIVNSGTLNQLAKFAADGTTLVNSTITETAIGDLGIGTSTPGGVIDLQRMSSGDILQRFWNTGTGGAKLRYVTNTGQTAQVQLTDLNEWLSSIAGNNTIGLQFRVRGVGTSNTEAQLDASARMTILRNGTVGIGTTTPSTSARLQVSTGNGGPTDAVYVYNTNSGGRAVYGSSNTGYGVEGVSGTSYAVYGSSSSGDGVVGESSSGYGVYGQSSSSYAGYFQGKVRVTGVLEKPGGGFKIDHPLEPENKYLIHSFVESPDMKNLYDGTVTTDANGEAEVTLPEWFAALNRDFRYQLTVIGVFAQAMIAEEIKDQRFKIRTSLPQVKVSWQVTGTRQDAWANQNRLPVEELKPAVERGSYQNPTAFGQPEEKSIEWARDPARMKQQQEQRERWQREQNNQAPAPAVQPNNR